jgi:uncharacterized protein (TIGR03067 family)
MKSRRSVLAGIVASGVLMARSGRAAVAEPKPEELMKRVVGTWRMVWGEAAGQAFPEAVTKSFRLTLTETTYVLKSGGPEDSGKVKWDFTKTPHEVDIEGVEGPNKGKKLPAILKFDGERVVLCYELGGGARPTEFKTAAGEARFLAVYERVKE